MSRTAPNSKHNAAAMASSVRTAFAHRLTTAREIHRVGGWTAIAEKILPLIGYHRVIIFEARFRPLAPVPPAEVDLDFAFVGGDETNELAAFRPGLSPTEIQRRFDKGERCFAARSHGEIVCAYWVSPYGERLANVGYRIEVPTDAVYVYDAFTARPMRGKRIAPAISRELKNRLAAEGFERWRTYVLGGNRSGMANMRRNGSQEVTRLAALRFWKLPPVRVAYRARRLVSGSQRRSRTRTLLARINSGRPAGKGDGLRREGD
jgi:hypothetical protein